MADGTTVDGTTITGAQTFQCRLANAHPSDAGSYTCVITGACGSTTTTAGVWSVDPAVPTVANDTCSTALNVGEGTFTFNPCGAYIDDVLTPSCVASSNKDVWFRYTPTFTGDARIETCGASFDTVLSVFTDCSGGELACNDDVNSGPGGCTASRSRLRVPVTAGVPVLVRSAAKGSLFSFTGSVVISQAPAIPANDECSAPVTIDMGTTAFNLAEATTNGFATCQPTAGSVRDLWYSFAPSCDGVFTINTCGSTMTNPILSVVDVCGGTEIFCNDNVGSGVSGCTSNQARILNVPVRGANPVLIRVAVSGTTVPSPATGVINIIKTGCLPDYNNDGNTDQDDVAYLINVVAGGDNPTGANPDFNCDGNVDQDDISALINVIAGGACP